MLTSGAPVKLKDGYARALMRCSRHKKVDWVARRGIVAWMNQRQVMIKWSDRRTLDGPYLIGGVEPA
jgi:hypothetical protein